MRSPSCTSRFRLATVRSRLWLLAVALAAALASTPSAAGAAPKRHELQAFASCSRFVHYARRHAANELRTRGVPAGQPLPTPVTRGPQPMSDQQGTAAPEAPPNAPAAGEDFSNTNVQEAGVDEPDKVKTDGQTIFVARGGTLYALDARSDPPKLLGSMRLGGSGHQLLLSGDRLLVMSGSPIVYGDDVIGAPESGVRPALAPVNPAQESKLLLVDVNDPSAMKVLSSMSVGGGYLNARMTGHTARVIFSATPRVMPLLLQRAPGERPAIRRTTTPDWRPTYKLRRGRSGKVARRALVRCTAIKRPDVFSGLNSLTVLTIDIDKGLEPVDSDAVMTDGQTVYASQESLYVATQKATLERPDAEQPPQDQVTEIHKFDTSKADETRYLGSGAVTGTLLNQYSMSEHEGFLRVASTNAPLWWSPGANRASESFVTVLKTDGALLRQVGRVGGIGKGERIYAVRFLGDVGYVVTFRQVDPLYTVGLSDPANPKVMGELELLGYSAYLHPVGEGLLLGVGQAADDQGRTQGTQVSLFDVSDPAKPARVANHVVGDGSSSAAEFDPHAFLWWDPLKLAVLPLQIYTYSSDGTYQEPFVGAIGFNATKAGGVTESGRVAHPRGGGYTAPIERSLVIGTRLFTVSGAGVMASDLKTLAERGFVAFPSE